MPQCAKCGREIPRKTGVYKVMKTGQYASGEAFMREVNLCAKCAADMDKQEAQQKKQKLMLMLLVLLVAAGGAVWWFFIRQPPQ